MEGLDRSLDACLRSLEGMRSKVDSKNLPPSDLLSTMLNDFTGNLKDLKSQSSAVQNISVPIELLKFVDNGVECNPDRYLLQLFREVDTECIEAASKVKRLKTMKNEVLGNI